MAGAAGVSLWYPVLDCGGLIFIAVLSVVSGLDGAATALCHALTGVVMSALILQAIIVVVVQPFTTVMSFAHTLLTLTLTLISATSQFIFMLAFNSTTKITGMWLVEVAAGCDFAVVGVTAMKLLLDAWQLFRAIRRRAHLQAELRQRYTASSDTLLLYLNSSFASGGSACR